MELQAGKGPVKQSGRWLWDGSIEDDWLRVTGILLAVGPFQMGSRRRGPPYTAPAVLSDYPAGGLGLIINARARAPRARPVHIRDRVGRTGACRPRPVRRQLCHEYPLCSPLHAMRQRLEGMFDAKDNLQSGNNSASSRRPGPASLVDHADCGRRGRRLAQEGVAIP